MFRKLLIQIAGKTYTPDNVHEIHDDPNITPADETVTNVVHGESGLTIQAGKIHGDVRLG